MNILQKAQRHFTWIAGGVVLALLALAAYIIISSLPPRRFTILTGREGGAYHETALKYQAIAAEKGFELELRPTAGSQEALELLESGEAGIGFVQGGVALDADPTILSTMASVFYEPVWIFYTAARFDGSVETLTALEGRAVAIGEPGSGANKLARQMLAANGIDLADLTLYELSANAAAEALRDGAVDAALFVSAGSAPVIQELVIDEAYSLMDLRQAEAFRAHLPFLTTVTLTAGAIDLRRDIPPEDVQLVATAANLVVRNDFHPDLLRLMTIAAVEVHEEGGLFERRFEFPNFDHADLPIGREERAYLERIRGGESTLDNYLPFWAAALIDRYLLFVVPVAILVVPLLARSPMLLTLYNRHKVTRWYRIVRGVDRHVARMDLLEVEKALADLDQIERQLQEQVHVSENFMADYYNLRGHIDLVQDRLQKRRDSLQNTPQEVTSVALEGS
jgi:TRAP transporter TAXI family solute receptor